MKDTLMTTKNGAAVAALVIAAVTCALPAMSANNWKPESTWRQNKKDSVLTLIKEAEALEEQKKFKAAKKVYKKVVGKSSNMANKATAIVAQGRCLHQLKDPWLAYRRYKEAIDDYANFIAFNDVLQLEYDIANTYFGGKRDSFMVFSFSTDGKAMEIYDHISTVAPYAPITPDAIHKSGLISLRSGDYAGAAEKFRQIITRYSRSDVVADAQIDLSKTLLKDAEEADGDETLVKQAHRELLSFIRLRPDHARIEEARELLKAAQKFEAEKLLYLAEFYQRPAHYRPEVSRRYLKVLLDKYGDTSSAELGRLMYSFLPPEPHAEPATAADSVAAPEAPGRGASHVD